MPQASPQRAAAPEVQYWEAPFVYDIDFTSTSLNGAINSQATVNGAIAIQADSDFRWIKSAYQADIAAAAFTQSAQPVPNITCMITDQGSGRQIFSAPIPVPSFFGYGYLPAIMPIPYIFRARSVITFQMFNYDAAVNYNLRLSLIGTKVFKGGNPAQ